MIPYALYIHLPWCVRKCPYCDFNSHRAPDVLPDEHYVNTLLRELEKQSPLVEGRSIFSIFIGGGTPSLFSPAAIHRLLKNLPVSREIEITLEANPGTVEQTRFVGFREAGINRLSLGVQSFHDTHLKTLGRIHDAANAHRAIDSAQRAGLQNINIDLMHGLPQQTIAEALSDLQMAIDHEPTHISWYQLTLEPNTLFAYQPPTLPDEDLIADMQTQGQQLLKAHGYLQYEVSAYARAGFQCRHNLNYWQFGDYLGLGAGAHSKLTHLDRMVRHWNIKHPDHYLKATDTFIAEKKVLTEKDLIFEFMLNGLRLTDGIALDLFYHRTQLTRDALNVPLQLAIDRGLLTIDHERLHPTELGKRFLNDLIAVFL